MRCLLLSSILLVALGQALGKITDINDSGKSKIKINVEDLQHILKSNNIPQEVLQTILKQSTETSAGNDNTGIVEQTVYQLLPTASDLIPENRVAYFREDIGLSSQHWHWHQSYPFVRTNSTTRESLDSERRGELFYYFHEQINARYNAERLSNNLSRVVPLSDWKAPIKEACFPKLDRLLGSRIYPSRPENQVLTDTNLFNVSNLDQWKKKLDEVINSGIMINSTGASINLTEVNGIDTLTNILTVFSNEYGSFFQAGFYLISRVHDPFNLYLEGPNLIAFFGVVIRDPAPFRFETFLLDNIYSDYQKTLPSYSNNELSNPGVTVNSVKIVSSRGTNKLLTFWQNAVLNLTRGIDFVEPRVVLVNSTYLNHTNFKYNIQVTSNSTRQATCRIFMSPKFNESGQTWPLAEQKWMFFELDKFVVNLKKGVNKITRDSTQSSVTIPFHQTFRDLQFKRPADNDTEALRKFNFQGCGWPQNLLVPKGSEAGIDFQLFLMFSNTKDDILTGTPMLSATETIPSNGFKRAHSYCGLYGEPYPDSRPMNFPFDRFPKEKTLKEFLRPNMKVVDVKIYHQNVTLNA